MISFGAEVRQEKSLDDARTTLVEVIEDLKKYPPTDLGIYALYAPNRYLAAKMRVFIDFLVQRFGEKPAWDRF